MIIINTKCKMNMIHILLFSLLSRAAQDQLKNGLGADANTFLGLFWVLQMHHMIMLYIAYYYLRWKLVFSVDYFAIAKVFLANFCMWMLWKLVKVDNREHFSWNGGKDAKRWKLLSPQMISNIHLKNSLIEHTRNHWYLLM